MVVAALAKGVDGSDGLMLCLAEEEEDVKNLEDKGWCGGCVKRPTLLRAAVAWLLLLCVKKLANLELLAGVEANVRLEIPWTSLVAFVTETSRANGFEDIIVNIVEC